MNEGNKVSSFVCVHFPATEGRIINEVFIKFGIFSLGARQIAVC